MVHDKSKPGMSGEKVSVMRGVMQSLLWPVTQYILPKGTASIVEYISPPTLAGKYSQYAHTAYDRGGPAPIPYEDIFTMRDHQYEMRPQTMRQIKESPVAAMRVTISITDRSTCVQ